VWKLGRSGFDMSLLESVRGTVHGVLGASRHLAWYVSWHTGAADAVRDRGLS
jgi:hypothetical protein